GNLLCRAAPARADRVPRRESLEAVAVVRAGTVEGILRTVVRDAHVPELGVEEAVHQPAVGHSAPADAGADGDVAERLEAGRGAPAVLTESGGVDVGVEPERKFECGA